MEPMDLDVFPDEVDLEALVACYLDDLLLLTAVGGFLLEVHCRLHAAWTASSWWGCSS